MPQRPNTTTAKILDVTFKLIAEFDISGVSVDMVAARARVSKATIYRRWDSRAGLMAEAMTRLRRPNSSPNTGSVRDDLIVVLNELVAYLNAPDTSRVLLSFLNAAVRDPDLALLQQDISREARSAYMQVLQRGIERGELPAAIDLQLAIDLLIAPFLYQGVVEHTGARKNDIERVVDVTLAGFGWKRSKKHAHMQQ